MPGAGSVLEKEAISPSAAVGRLQKVCAVEASEVVSPLANNMRPGHWFAPDGCGSFHPCRETREACPDVARGPG